MKSFKRTIALWTAAVLAAGSLPVGGADIAQATEVAEVQNETATDYTPVVTGNTKVTGYQNGKSTLDMQLAARHNSGACNAEGGSLEIVEYNATNGYAYAVSGLKGKIIAVKADEIPASDKVEILEGTEYDVKDLVSSKSGFEYGDITSVAISPDGKKLAAAVQHADMAENGVVAIFECQADGSLKNTSFVEVGVQPDMVVYADNDTILTADEGEPRDGYGEGCTDPEGTVSIVNVNEKTSVQVGFENYTADTLSQNNIIVGVSDNTIAPEFDMEPEYIAVTADGKRAFVSLQEANAVAVLDVSHKTFTGIYSVGYEDYSKVAVDLVDDGKYEAKTYENLVGARMPDGIALYENGGKTYLVTANEGDAREWGDYTNEAKTKGFTGKNIRILDPETCAGLPDGKSVMFGGRGFSVFEVTESGLQEVYDSANEFEKITGEVLPQYFNCSNDDIEADSRSPKKGPEPENVTVGTVGDRTYAFVAVERIGGIMVYDITDPAKTTYVNYINSREFDSEIQGDVSPEGLCFVAGDSTRKPMLFAACEVSGTLAVYELTVKNQGTEEKPSDGKEEDKPQTPGQGEIQTPGQGTEQSQEQNQSNVTEEQKEQSVGNMITDTKTSATYQVTNLNHKKKTATFAGVIAKEKTTVEIPSTVKLDGVAYQVTTIADNACKNNKTITKVIIPKSVTTIGKNAFSGCTKLKTVSIGSQVTTIGANAFKGCKALTSVTLPAKTTKIGANAFNGCSKLKTITIKSKKLTAKSVSKNAFKGISSKVTIKVPKGKAMSYRTLFRKKGLSKKVTVK